VHPVAASPVRPRAFLIVQRTRADIVPRLQAEFPQALVIVDRRHDQRRREVRPARVDRRRGRDRRAALLETEEWMWRTAGYRITYRLGP
jgi:hypothetical protein